MKVFYKAVEVLTEALKPLEEYKNQFDEKTWAEFGRILTSWYNKKRTIKPEKSAYENIKRLVIEAKRNRSNKDIYKKHGSYKLGTEIRTGKPDIYDFYEKFYQDDDQAREEYKKALKQWKESYKGEMADPDASNINDAALREKFIKINTDFANEKRANFGTLNVKFDTFQDPNKQNKIIEIVSDYINNLKKIFSDFNFKQYFENKPKELEDFNKKISRAEGLLENAKNRKISAMVGSLWNFVWGTPQADSLYKSAIRLTTDIKRQNASNTQLSNREQLVAKKEKLTGSLEDLIRQRQNIGTKQKTIERDATPEEIQKFEANMLSKVKGIEAKIEEMTLKINDLDPKKDKAEINKLQKNIKDKIFELNGLIGQKDLTKVKENIDLTKEEKEKLSEKLLKEIEKFRGRLDKLDKTKIGLAQQMITNLEVRKRANNVMYGDSDEAGIGIKVQKGTQEVDEIDKKTGKPTGNKLKVPRDDRELEDDLGPQKDGKINARHGSAYGSFAMISSRSAKDPVVLRTYEGVIREIFKDSGIYTGSDEDLDIKGGGKDPRKPELSDFDHLMDTSAYEENDMPTKAELTKLKKDTYDDFTKLYNFYNKLKNLREETTRDGKREARPEHYEDVVYPQRIKERIIDAGEDVEDIKRIITGVKKEGLRILSLLSRGLGKNKDKITRDEYEAMASAHEDEMKQVTDKDKLGKVISYLREKSVEKQKALEEFDSVPKAPELWRLRNWVEEAILKELKVKYGQKVNFGKTGSTSNDPRYPIIIGDADLVYFIPQSSFNYHETNGKKFKEWLDSKDVEKTNEYDSKFLIRKAHETIVNKEKTISGPSHKTPGSLESKRESKVKDVTPGQIRRKQTEAEPNPPRQEVKESPKEEIKEEPKKKFEGIIPGKIRQPVEPPKEDKEIDAAAKAKAEERKRRAEEWEARKRK